MISPLAVKIQGQGFPVLCLHGHPGSGACLTVFTEFLSQTYCTITPDLRGYGHSQVPQTFTMTDHLDDLEMLLDEARINHCLILGWSLGGILALEMALRHPHRVSGLILVATAARPRGDHPPITWRDQLFTGIAAGINWLFPGWSWNIRTFGQRSLFRHLLCQQTPATYHYLAEAAVPAFLKTSKAANQALGQALKVGYDRVPNLGEITSPCLVLAGERDRHIMAAASLETANHLQNSHWICYPNTAHLFPWEIPNQVLQDVDQWLQRHPEAVT